MTDSRWPRRAGVVAAALGLVLALSSASPAQAETNPACPSGVEQIGTTGHVMIRGFTFASVKQFKGCGKNWAYIYVWKSWRDSHTKWNMCVSVAKKNASPPPEWNLVDANCDYDTRRVEMWSNGADTLAYCTHAWGNHPQAAGMTAGRSSTVC